MPNSDLKNKRFYIPLEIKALIKKNNYTSQRKNNLLKKGYLSYYDLKNYLKDYDTFSVEEKKSVGGKQFIKWCESTLTANRDSIHSKKTNAKNAGQSNQFIRSHEKGKIELTKNRIPRFDKGDPSNGDIRYEQNNRQMKKKKFILSEGHYTFLKKLKDQTLAESAGFEQIDEQEYGKNFGGIDVSVDFTDKTLGVDNKALKIVKLDIKGELNDGFQPAKFKNSISKLCSDCNIFCVNNLSKVDSKNMIVTSIIRAIEAANSFEAIGVHDVSYGQSMDMVCIYDKVNVDIGAYLNTCSKCGGAGTDYSNQNQDGIDTCDACSGLGYIPENKKKQ